MKHNLVTLSKADSIIFYPVGKAVKKVNKSVDVDFPPY